MIAAAANPRKNSRPLVTMCGCTVPAAQSWMNLDPGVSIPFDKGDTRQWFDLQNALTHEFGHFIGLDHTCFIQSADGSSVSADGKLRPKDDQGIDVPNCDASPANVQLTVMFNVTRAAVGSFL